MKAQDYWTLGLSLTAILVSIFGVVYSGLLAQENRRAEGLQVVRSVAVASRMDFNNAGLGRPHNGSVRSCGP